MTEDQAPPTPVPPAAQAPYPAHPAPHGHTDEIPVAKKAETGVGGLGVSGLGIGLIGGAVAAAIGLAFALPLFRKRPAPAKTGRKNAAPRKAAARRKPAAPRKRKTDN